MRDNFFTIDKANFGFFSRCLVNLFQEKTKEKIPGLRSGISSKLKGSIKNPQPWFVPMMAKPCHWHKPPR